MFNPTLHTEPVAIAEATTEPTASALITSDATAQLVDILIDVSDRADACIVTIADRVIIEQLRRGHEPTLGHGVSLVKGVFRATSGPGHCPTIGRNNAVLLVRGVDHAVALAAGYDGDGVFKPTMTDFWVAAVEHRHAGARLV
ncbi:hypothetical protein RCH23_002121 [Cryobacterium sp. CAN_C3]|uniref:hypothetical protein n=1 Tax=unclassified Cryobacterium TaxID=2649013 RepID=UPI0018CB6051|nr:hypothetical protein [Cryobacterium sp. CAN_C3]MEC5154736.1 hypothetical protein [Cryobacterium sp. CAN_C3]